MRGKRFSVAVTGTQLCIIKKELERMKSYYLQLFMDMDHILKFPEEKEMEAEYLDEKLGGLHPLSYTTNS